MGSIQNPAQRRALDINNAAPGIGCFSVTPSDATDFTFFARALYIGVTGDVAIVNLDDSVVVWTACPAGLIIPCGAKRVNSTATTATNIVGIL